MVRLTVELVRKRAEHHDRCLAPLEEVALHQENIEKIEYLQDWCPKLKILLLQSNLIAKIENLNKLKHLTYLNLALNNIEVIENLERLESLEKLDLTLNFIGQVTSVESLKNNYNLRKLYLTGNPCVDYENYKEFVIGTLQQLDHLDGKDIERSHKIICIQKLPFIRSDILFEQENYRHKRLKQKTRLERQIEEKFKNIDEILEDDQRVKDYYDEPSENAPEVRVEIERFKALRQKKLDEKGNVGKKEEKPKRKLFTNDGRALNMNEPKIDFHFDDTDPSKYVLDLAVYKYLETSLVDADVNPKYVRVTLKGKVFQMNLLEEVDVSKSTAKRSETTGHMVITMPKLNYVGKTIDLKKKENDKKSLETQKSVSVNSYPKREYLEIGSSVEDVLDLTAMTRNNIPKNYTKNVQQKEVSADFVDDPNVPPLV